MQTDKKVFDDVARLANALVGTLVGVRQEVTAQVRQRVERMLTDLDLVAREEFDAVKDMAAEARSENDRLARRVTMLERALGGAGKPSAKAAKPASPAKRRASAKARSKRAAR